MKVIPAEESLEVKLANDINLQRVDLNYLRANYELVSNDFHKHFIVGADDQHQNAIFHKIRYLELLGRKWTGRTLDVGNDKPFLSFFLRKFNQSATFETISNEIPQTPFVLYEVDIEREPFPFADSTFDHIIFTEVIEHLWRNPSHCVCEMNRVLKTGGGIYLTTPNPCDRHSLVCILWQANPNQRSGYFATLESGHLHLWTAADLKLIFESHGFLSSEVTTKDLYGHTRPDENIEKFIAQVSKYRDLMNEAVVLTATKIADSPAPVFPASIFPDGVPVKVQGAIKGFLEDQS
jgi:SAM-dependent methyltransferase